MENHELSLMFQLTQAPVISENLMDMGAQLRAEADYINSLPRTRENALEVKKRRTEFNRKFAEAEEGRKAVRKACLAPYERAQKLYDGFVSAPFAELDKACKDFVGEVENRDKAECEDRLKAYFAELCGMRGLPWLKWERLGLKVDLTTARQKEPRKAMDTIKAFVDRVYADLDAIARMEDGAELAAEYESCLDLTTAIQRVQSRKDAVRIAEENRKCREERKAEAAQLMETVTAADVGTVVNVQAEKKFQTTFTVTATLPMLRGLRAFLDGHQYEYQEEN